jgi:circadian clock protein KaiB
MDRVVLKLFVSGLSASSQRAMMNARELCEHPGNGRCDLEIIDVEKHPQLAEDHRILATPTLIRVTPAPIRRIIGDLSDRQRVLIGLELVQVKP